MLNLGDRCCVSQRYPSIYDIFISQRHKGILVCVKENVRTTDLRDIYWIKVFPEDVKSIVKGNECFVSVAVMEFLLFTECDEWLF